MILVGMVVVRVYLTGGVRVEGPQGVVVASQLPGGQGRLALAALVLERRPLSRDQLADIVWGDAPPPRWTGALHTIVSKLRSLLNGAGLDGRTVLPSTGGGYELHLPPSSWVDIEDAVRRLDLAEGALRHDDARTATAEATVAWSILRRPLLTGLDGDWVERQRDRQRLAAHRCGTVLADGWLRRDNPDLAAVIAESTIALDELRETGHRLLARAEWARGDRGAALRALERCERIMADELGVAPSPETMHLAERIRS